MLLFIVIPEFIIYVLAGKINAPAVIIYTDTIPSHNT